MFRKRILEMVANSEVLETTLEQICLEVEQLLGRKGVAVVGVDAAGAIRPLAGPSFPEPYREALDGIVIGPETGSCGSAIYLNSPVFVADIEHDPKWAAYKSLALPLGWKACHSIPLQQSDGKPTGAIALYLREARWLSEAERAVLVAAADLCELVMLRDRRSRAQERQKGTDQLTGIPGRSAFDRTLSRLRCELPGSWALLVLDIDNLKDLNETLGYEAGDTVVATIARRMSGALAPDRTFRTDGGEFTAIIQEKQALLDLASTAKHLRDVISAPFQCEGHTVRPRATIGAAVLAPQDTNPAVVRRNAEFALYHAKDTCRGSFARYRPGIGSRAAHPESALNEVAAALRDGRIDAYYQPVLRLDTKEVYGFEALARMTNAAGRTIPASMFSEAFSDARLACQITDRMLAIVARDLRAWLDEGLNIHHVGMNVTSADFYGSDLPAKLEAAFNEYQLPLNSLIIEVTEDTYLGQRDRIVALGIADLRTRGVRVALDDFGTGFAALAHLLTVPINAIKIDQSFVQRLIPGDPSLAITRGIVQIARELNMAVIAEGIETADQAETLLSMGCVLGQGFVFAKAIDRRKAALLYHMHGEGMPGARPLGYGSYVDKARDRGNVVRLVSPHQNANKRR